MREKIHASEDRLIISQSQDVEPFLKSAHEARAARGEHTSHKSETFNLKMRIPEVVAMDWCKKKGIKYGDFLADTSLIRRFVNDPDNKAFSLIPGRI